VASASNSATGRLSAYQRGRSGKHRTATDSAAISTSSSAVSASAAPHLTHQRYRGRDHQQQPRCPQDAPRARANLDRRHPPPAPRIRDQPKANRQPATRRRMRHMKFPRRLTLAP